MCSELLISLVLYNVCLLLFMSNFSLYTTYYLVGRGNIVSRHSVLYAPPNFRNTPRWMVAQLNITIYPVTKARKCKKNHFPEWKWNPQPPLRHDSFHICKIVFELPIASDLMLFSAMQALKRSERRKGKWNWITSDFIIRFNFINIYY